MRLPESAIKAAVLHPEEEVRVTAVSYFSGSFSQDEAVMPLVIEAIQRCGRDKAFRVLQSAERLPQTQATIDWLVQELRRDYDLADPCDDNYRFAIALILCRAGLEVLLARQGVIMALPMFPDPLRASFAKRIEMASWGWDRAWAALEALGQETTRKGGFTWKDVRYADAIIESLARDAGKKAPFVLIALQQRYVGMDRALMLWLRPLLINLAGAMRLQAAIPSLLGYLCDDNVSAADESITALIRIGDDSVVSAITDHWRDASTAFRAAASDVLEHIHTDFCAQSCLRFFEAEDDLETRSSLAYAVLSQFLEEGVEPVRQFVLEQDEGPGPNRLDIRYRLVVACAVMGISFPEYEQWQGDAVRDNWGLGDYQPPRLADSFLADLPGPRRTRDGREQ